MENMENFVLFESFNQFLKSALIVLTITWLVKRFITKTPAKLNLPPGPAGLPLLGNALALTGDRLALFSSWARKYGDIFLIRVGFTRFIFLNSFEAMSEAFQIPQLNGRLHNKFRLITAGHYNHGVVTAVGTTWREQRQYVHKVFRQLGVGKRSYEETIMTEVARLSEAIKGFEGRPFDPDDLVCCAVSNIICTSVFGTQFSYSDPEFREILHVVARFFELSGTGNFIKKLPFFYLIPFGQPKALADTYRAVFNFIDKMIKLHQETHDADHPRDFIDLYLETIKDEDGKGSTFDKDNLKATIFDLFVAGTETTATMVKWLMFYMMAYPEVQSRVQAELDQVIGTDRTPSLADRDSLPFTNATLLECQRHSHAVPLSIAHMAMEDTVLRGYTIPKGSFLYGYIGHIHSDERVWDRPDEFRPERFLRMSEDGRMHVINNGNIIPFSTGARVCPGEQLARQELFLFFAGLLHRFTLEKPEDSPPLSFKGVMGITRNTGPFETSAVSRDTKGSLHC